jgi:hypothetical protein
MNGRTLNRAVGAKHATVARLRTQHRFAVAAFEILASIGRHRFLSIRSGDSRRGLQHRACPAESALWDLTQNRLRRGVFRDPEELIMAIGDYIDKHNRHPKPFIWTAKASDILEKVKRASNLICGGHGFEEVLPGRAA